MRRLLARLHQRNEGFTLVELLVVVAIIALLTAFALPNVTSAIKKARGTTGQNDLTVISAALARYDFDNVGYPNATTEATFKSALAEYLKKGSALQNGNKLGYFYITDTPSAAGVRAKVFALVDPGEATAFKLTCGTFSYDGTSSANFTAVQTTLSNTSGCDLDATSKAAGATVVTN